jgi:hypothetical protein
VTVLTWTLYILIAFKHSWMWRSRLVESYLGDDNVEKVDCKNPIELDMFEISIRRVHRHDPSRTDRTPETNCRFKSAGLLFVGYLSTSSVYRGA